ncbi:MFS transporter [Acinetobacter schindleri]|uniref:MFS transporter n=1 Tax=Acinetobacter schindleri TaxID=108981 RepID=UPI003D089A28
MSAQQKILIDQSDSDRLYKKIVGKLLPLLMIAYILNYLDRSNIGFAKLQFMPDLGMTEAMFGLGAGLFYLGYSLWEIPNNLIMRKYGARITLARIMICWGLVSAAFMFMTTPMHYYILRVLLGIAEAGLFPGILLYISFWIPASRRAGFTAMFMSSMALASIIGGPLSGFIMHYFEGVSGMRGWQWMFLLEGIPTVLMGIVLLYKLVDKPAQAKWLTQQEKDLLQAEFDAEDSVRKTEVGGHHNFLSALRDLRFYSMAGMSMCLVAGGAGLQIWMPSIIRASGVSNVWNIGLLSALPFLVAVIVQQLIARRSDRAQERRWHAAVPTFVAAIGWVLLTQIEHNLVLSMIALTIIASGFLGATGPFWALPSRYLGGTAAAGGLALIAMLGGVGAFFSPTIVGELATATGNLKIGYLYYASLMIIGPLLMLYGTYLIEKDKQKA